MNKYFIFISLLSLIMECLTDKNGFLFTMVNNNYKFGVIKHNDVVNMNNELFLSKELFQYFIYHTYDNTIKIDKSAKGKDNMNGSKAFVVMFDLLENLENVNVDKLNTNVRNAFLYNKLNTFLIPKLNSTNNKYELYIVHNFENNYTNNNNNNTNTNGVGKCKSSSNSNSNSNRIKGNQHNNNTSTTSSSSTKSGYNALITSSPNNNTKTQLQQQMFTFIIKQIQKLYDICSHRNSNNNINNTNNNISPKPKQAFKSLLPFHILPFPEHCTSFETALLTLKICISSIKSINISWYLNTILHTKIDMSYLSSIKPSFISELKLKLFNTTKTCSQTANTSPLIYNRKSVLTKPVVNLIRRDIPGYQQYVKGATTYRKKIVQRNSSDYSFNKTLSDISTVKEFTITNKSKSNMVSTYQNTNANVNGSEIEKFNCNTYQSGSKQSMFNCNNNGNNGSNSNKFHTVKITTQGNIDDYAYMLAQKQSLNSTNTKDNYNNDTWLNSNNKYKLDVIEFTDEDKNDTIEEFNNSKCNYNYNYNNDTTERYKKGIAKIPKPKFRETIIMYKGGHRHPSYEHSLRNSHSLTEKAKCGNLKEECTIF